MSKIDPKKLKEIFNDEVLDILPNNESLKREIKYAKISLAQKGISKPDEVKQKISKNLKGKTLEVLLGTERAIEGRKIRAKNSSGPRPEGIGQKIANTRRLNGSYENNGMTGKTHKEITKQIQSIKAKIRQELKQQLGLGRNDSIPKELLEIEYKKRGI